MAWEEINKADQDWDREAQFLFNQGTQFALCEPSKRVFRPVNNNPVGDDSDDSNGWRAKTRLRANDFTGVLVEEKQMQYLIQGELQMNEVYDLYQKSLKLPAYLQFDKPSEGFGAGAKGRGKLRGLMLLPLSNEGLWNGIDDKGNHYKVSYDNELGLIAGRIQ